MSTGETADPSTQAIAPPRTTFLHLYSPRLGLCPPASLLTETLPVTWHPALSPPVSWCPLRYSTQCALEPYSIYSAMDIIILLVS